MAFTHLHVHTEYSLLDRVLYFLKQEKIAPYDQTYTDRVSLKIRVETARADEIVDKLVALSGGTVSINELGEGFFPLSIDGTD